MDGLNGLLYAFKGLMFKEKGGKKKEVRAGKGKGGKEGKKRGKGQGREKGIGLGPCKTLILPC